MGPAQPGDRRAGRRADGGAGRGDGRLDGGGVVFPDGLAGVNRWPTGSRSSIGKTPSRPGDRPSKSATVHASSPRAWRREGNRPGRGRPGRPRLALDARGPQDRARRCGGIPESGSLEPGCLARAGPQAAQDQREHRSLHHLAFSPDGRRSQRVSIRVIVRSRHPSSSGTPPRGQSSSLSPARSLRSPFGPDGKVLFAVAEPHAVLAIELATGRVLWTTTAYLESYPSTST